MDINQVYKLDNLLTADELQGFNKLCNNYVWEFGSATYNESRKFWLKNLWGDYYGKCEEIELGFRKKLESIFNVQLETMELYLNGQAHGQCGDMHSDFDETWDDSFEYITLVYYTNPEWKPEYGGFTCITDNLDNLHIVYPKPNSAVVFNSRFKHVGLEPTVHCIEQRVTMALKLKVLK